MHHASEWSRVWSAPGERMFVEAQTDASYTRHRFLSNGDGPGALAVAVRNGLTLFIRLYRPVTGETLIELPRGQGELEDGGDAARAAQRELCEETGWRSGNATILGKVWPDSGLCGDATSVVFCGDLEEPTPTQAANAEVQDLLWLSPAEIRTYIASGAIADGQTLAALLIAEVL